MDSKLSVLIVEDEPKIRSGLRDFLEYHGYEVTEALDGLEADHQVAQKSFNLILLDLMLPKISGEELATRWRQKGIQSPIIMLTAKGQEQEKIKGLNLGADDYMTKPFSLEELHARIQAVLRRTDPNRAVGQTFSFGHWHVNIAELKVTSNSTTQKISNRESLIIQYFAAYPNRVIPRNELYEKIWNEPMTDLGTRTVDMHIAKLRKKIENNLADPQIIKTVRGVGYQYEI